jgi:hypothetical protein
MQNRLKPLEVKPNENDKRLAAAAIYSHAMERFDASRTKAPLNHLSRASRDRYLHALTDRERALRKSATEMRRWSVSFKPALQAVPLADVYEGKAVMPPQGIRFLSGTWDFYLVKLIGRIGMAKGTPVQTIRLALELDPGVRGPARRASAITVFPKSEWKKYGAGDILFGLRSNLRFWVPTTEDGTPFVRAKDMPRRLKTLLLVGPEKASFRRLGVEGKSVGDGRVEWNVKCTLPFRSTELRTWMVLQVPRRKRRVRVRATLEAEVLMPQALAGLVGQRRMIRDRRNWLRTLPPAGAL